MTGPERVEIAARFTVGCVPSSGRPKSRDIRIDEGCGIYKKTHKRVPFFIPSLPSPPPSWFLQSKPDGLRSAPPRYPPPSGQSTGRRRRRFARCLPYSPLYPACVPTQRPRTGTRPTVDKQSIGPLSPGTRRDLGTHTPGVGESRRESLWG